MSDTETEAHRLLVAAAEDRPPEIDLLGGFAAARRRDRTRRIRGRAVLLAGTAVTAASVTAVALTVGSAPPALATVTSALTHSLAQNYHATETTNSYYIWNGRITDRAPQLTCTSVANPGRHLAAESCSNGPLYREVGGYTYNYIPFPVDHPGRHWWRVLSADLRHVPSVGDFVEATPPQMLSQIKKASNVTVVGPVSGPGWMGTRYAFTSSQGFKLSDRLSGTVDLDRQGRARALVLTDRETSSVNVFVMTWTLTFSGFGAPVTVTPPPADQTFSGP